MGTERCSPRLCATNGCPGTDVLLLGWHCHSEGTSGRLAPQVPGAPCSRLIMALPGPERQQLWHPAGREQRCRTWPSSKGTPVQFRVPAGIYEWRFRDNAVFTSSLTTRQSCGIEAASGETHGLCHPTVPL